MYVKFYECNNCGQDFCVSDTTNSKFYCPHCKSDNLVFKDINPFLKYTDHLAGTLYSKNQAYGDSFTKSIEKYGLSVIGIRLSDKYNRIEHLITNNELKENDESLEDTLLDMAGYSILGLKYLEEHKDENN